MDGDDDDDDDSRGDDIDHNNSPEFAMHTAEEAICLCIYKKGIHWF